MTSHQLSQPHGHVENDTPMWLAAPAPAPGPWDLAPLNAGILPAQPRQDERMQWLPGPDAAAANQVEQQLAAARAQAHHALLQETPVDPWLRPAAVVAGPPVVAATPIVERQVLLRPAGRRDGMLGLLAGLVLIGVPILGAVALGAWRAAPPKPAVQAAAAAQVVPVVTPAVIDAAAANAGTTAVDAGATATAAAPAAAAAAPATAAAKPKAKLAGGGAAGGSAAVRGGGAAPRVAMAAPRPAARPAAKPRPRPQAAASPKPVAHQAAHAAAHAPAAAATPAPAPAAAAPAPVAQPQVAPVAAQPVAETAPS